MKMIIKMNMDNPDHGIHLYENCVSVIAFKVFDSCSYVNSILIKIRQKYMYRAGLKCSPQMTLRQ